MAEDLYSAILNSAARNAARQEMDTTALDRLAMEQQLARILAGQRRRERKAEIWPGGTFTLVEPEKRPNNALYELLNNARLNRGLENLAGNAAEVIFGEPTGNAVIDYGVSNIPGVGAVAIGAGGGQPGLIDILGGIGAPLKGMAVVAKPLASRIIRNASYTTGQDLGMDAARNVARNVIDRMARIQGDVTGDEIYPFIKEEMQNLGLVGARDEARIRELATGFAEDTYLRALEDLEAGKTPRLNLVLPEKENIAYKPLYEGIEGADDGLRMGEPAKLLQRDRRELFRNYSKQLSEDDIENAVNLARERIEQAIADGNFHDRPYSLIMANKRLDDIEGILRYQKHIDTRPMDFITVPAAKISESQHAEELHKAYADAYAKAKEEAIRKGLTGRDAIDDAERVAMRAQNALMKDIAPELVDSWNKYESALNYNMKTAFSILPDDLKEEIASQAEELRKATRDKLIAEGAPKNKIRDNPGYTARDYIRSRTREALRNLGFGSPNDPNLHKYVKLGRTLEESQLRAPGEVIGRNEGFVPDPSVNIQSVSDAITELSLDAATRADNARAPKNITGVISTAVTDEADKMFIRNAQSDAYQKAKAEAIAAGYNTNDATKIANAAGNRARVQAIRELGGEVLGNRQAAGRDAKRNIRAAYSRLHPDLKNEVKAEAERVREEVSAKYEADGMERSKARLKGNDAAHTYERKRTLEILKELGFKNANDPRLQNYEVIGRTPEESVMKAVADDIFGE